MDKKEKQKLFKHLDKDDKEFRQQIKDDKELKKQIIRTSKQEKRKEI